MHAYDMKMTLSTITKSRYEDTEFIQDEQLTKNTYIGKFKDWIKPDTHKEHQCIFSTYLLVGCGFKAISGYKCSCGTFFQLVNVTRYPDILTIEENNEFMKMYGAK